MQFEHQRQIGTKLVLPTYGLYAPNST